MKASQVLKLKGWESTQLDRRVDDEKAREVSSLYRQAFSTDAGQRVLELLTHAFLTKPVARPGDDILAVGIREGRADVVRQILREIEKAEG